MAPRRPRVLVTRSPLQSSELADTLRSLGADPILIPAIEFTAPTSFAALDAALAHLESFHWLLFTSANAVEALHHRLTKPRPRNAVTQAPTPVILSEGSRCEPQPKDPPHSPYPARPSAPSATDPDAPFMPQLHRGMGGERIRIAAIGPSTARALESLALTPDLIPPQAVAESFTQALLPYAHQPDGSPTRFLLVRAESIGDTPPREHLPETLRAAGAGVTIAPAYRTLIPQASIPALRSLFEPPPWVPHLRGSLIAAKVGVDAITFTSSSTVRNLLALCEAAAVTLPPGALRISIGPITSQTLRDTGYPPHAESPQPTVAALAETVVKTLQTLQRP